MDLNKPATVKQVMLIVWGPALIAAVLWIIGLGVIGAQERRAADDASIRAAAQHHEEAQKHLREAGYVR
jgi:hypothetical protein